MIPNRLANRLATVGAVAALACLGVPQVASGAVDQKIVNSTDPSVLMVKVNITDTGFDKPEITLPQGGNLAYGQITFTNTGTKTHSATQIPGTPNYGQFVAVNTPDGNTIQNTFDTGGIAPGQSQIAAFSYDGDYSYTSSPDCLAHDAVAGTFNCTPAIVHVVDYNGPTGALAHSLDGETLSDPGRRIPHRDKSGGSVSHPLSNPPVIHINGVGGSNPPGFFPSRVYVTPGTTVTWINDDPNNVHEVRQRSHVNNPNEANPINSGGLAQGQTYSYTFPYNNDTICNSSGPGQCGGVIANSYTYQSGGFKLSKKQALTNDTILPKMAGFDGSVQSTMIAKIYVVIKCASVDAHQNCIA